MELDFTEAVVNARLDDYEVVITAWGWVKDLDADYGSRYVQVNVRSNLDHNQWGVGPHDWYYTEVNRNENELMGSIYDCREDAMKEALEFFNWLIPHALNNENHSIQEILKWAKLWQDIRYMLGYNWNDSPTDEPTHQNDVPDRLARLEKSLAEKAG